MQTINKSIEVNLSQEEAFNAFVRELTLWWPKSHTWSKDKLIEIGISPITGGHCTEIGPRNFRCDWGTVTDVKLGSHITFKWQITPSGAPEPDPEKASEVFIGFSPASDGCSRVELEHGKFENHGEGFEAYCNAMNGPQGWEHLLTCFAVHARTAQRLTVEVNS